MATQIYIVTLRGGYTPESSRDVRPPAVAPAPSVDVHPDGCFVGLAISGGGSRSANFSAGCMLHLQQIGLLRRDPTKPRAIELMVGKAKQALKGPGIPIVGNVAAGEPILADENIEDYVEVPSTIGGEGGDYILKVRGDSMIKAGILDGDFVVVRPTEEASNGEIVVALLEDEATVKRYYREKNTIRLQPENDEHEPIRTPDAELLGKVIGVFRTV